MSGRVTFRDEPQEHFDIFSLFLKASTASPENVRKDLEKEKTRFRQSVLTDEEILIAAGNRVYGGTFIADAIGRMTGEELSKYRERLQAEADRAARIIDCCAKAEAEIKRELTKLGGLR